MKKIWSSFFFWNYTRRL